MAAQCKIDFVYAMLHTFRKGVCMSGHRVDRNRRSAKGTVTELIDSILKRPDDIRKKNELDLLATICSRMSWQDLFNKIIYRDRHQQVEASENEPRPQIQKAHWYQD